MVIDALMLKLTDIEDFSILKSIDHGLERAIRATPQSRNEAPVNVYIPAIYVYIK